MKSFNLSNAKVAFKEAISTDNDYVKASQWINKDLTPTPVEARTWTWVSLSGYLWGNAFNTSQWPWSKSDRLRWLSHLGD